MLTSRKATSAVDVDTYHSSATSDDSDSVSRKTLREANKHLREDNRELRQKISQLEAALTSVRNDLDRVKKANETFGCRTEALRDDSHQLRAAQESLLQANQAVRGQQSELSRRHMQLQAGQDALRRSLASISRSAAALSLRHDELRENCRKHRTKLKAVSSEFRAAVGAGKALCMAVSELQENEIRRQQEPGASWFSFSARVVNISMMLGVAAMGAAVLYKESR